MLLARRLYRTTCHPDFLAQFVVPGLAGMSGLISSWRPGAYAAWTIRAYRQFMSSSSPPLACSGFKNDVYFMRGKSRDISCGSPLEDDQVVRRCLLTISAFCSRLRGVWSSCSLPCSAPSAPFRCASDVVLAGYARMCADTIMWASFAHTLRGSGARVWARLWSTANLNPFLCLLQAWFESVTSWFTGR